MKTSVNDSVLAGLPASVNFNWFSVQLVVVPKKFQLELHHMIIMQSQVLSLLSIQHHKSRVCHSQSQGALKCFYQTLKLMLRNYCLDSGGTKVDHF